MAITLSVRKLSDASPPDTYHFDEEVVSIGRDGTNMLTLPDPDRLVSKKHAEIRCRDDAAQLVDLHSKNFTYLNGERLEPGRPRALQGGDTIQIGDFEVQFEFAVPTLGADDDRTVFAPSFINPFEDDVQQLVEAFNRICQTFEQEPPVRRRDALQDAVRAMIVETEPPEARALLADLLGLSDTASDQAMKEPEGRSRPAPPATPPQERTPAAAFRGPASRQEAVLQAIFDAVARLVAIPAQFKYEFIGQTIMHTPESAFLYEQDPELLARHLLDPDLPEDEAEKRCALLKEALEDVAAHQMAMLEGYKAAVKSGAERLVDFLDPAQLVEELGEGKALHRLVPGRAKQEAAEAVQERCRELREGDWAVAEQRFYRPEFIRAYLMRQSGAPSR